MSQNVVIAALYHFTNFEDFKDWQAPLQNLMTTHGVRGTLLIAPEGINGTIAGPQAGIDAILGHIKADERFDGISVKFSYDDEIPFNKTRVRLKKEIVTFRREDANPLQTVGTYVNPEDWNELIEQDDVVLIDTRNDYEVDIGTFKGAVNPNTKKFTELVDYVAENLHPEKNKKVAMFCTGGIRCEKASAYMLEQGFEEVYHLNGGILNYLEKVPEQESLWEGECFVFDKRVAVKHGVEPGSYDICHACRYPISDEDKASDTYVEGISCPHCHDSLPEKTRARAAERQKQIDLAKQRGE